MSAHLTFIIDFFSDAMRLRQRFETARLRAETYGFDAWHECKVVLFTDQILRFDLQQ